MNMIKCGLGLFFIVIAQSYADETLLNTISQSNSCRLLVIKLINEDEKMYKIEMPTIEGSNFLIIPLDKKLNSTSDATIFFKAEKVHGTATIFFSITLQEIVGNNVQLKTHRINVTDPFNTYPATFQITSDSLDLKVLSLKINPNQSRDCLFVINAKISVKQLSET